MKAESILTIGHSDHSLKKFHSLLNNSAVGVVIDVRSSPFSRRSPHFNKQDLKGYLEDNGISYFFIGNKLGGRPRSGDLYTDGVADYEAMARTVSFKDGVAQVIRASVRNRVALMCSEHDPLDCHRCLLIGREVARNGLSVSHILASGMIESHEEAERRLVQLEGFQGDDFFASVGGRVDLAYRRRAQRVAYRRPDQIAERRTASR